MEGIGDSHFILPFGVIVWYIIAFDLNIKLYINRNGIAYAALLGLSSFWVIIFCQGAKNHLVKFVWPSFTLTGPDKFYKVILGSLASLYCLQVKNNKVSLII